MAHVRTYNSKVLVGNWFEDIALKEEMERDFLDRKSKGTLLSQKLVKIFGGDDAEVVTSPCADGILKFGDRVQLLNVGADPIAVQAQKAVPRPPVVVGMSLDAASIVKPDGLPEVMPVSASQNLEAKSRNIFEIVSVDGSSQGQPVLYTQPFQLCSCAQDRYYLCSDSIGLSAKKMKHCNQHVVMSPTNHFNTHWRAEFYHPQFRLENELAPIKTGAILVLKHLKTNQALSLEKDFVTKTLFGNELEVSAHTKLTDHKVEADTNYWIMAPGQFAVDTQKQLQTDCPTE